VGERAESVKEKIMKKDDFTRINNVIQADKSVMSDACKTLVLQDFAEKFNEYFDLMGLPRMELACKNGIYTVHITFEAERIKKFNVLK
jgi:hypothetical protein